MTAPLSLATVTPEPDPRPVLIRIEGLNKHYGAFPWTLRWSPKCRMCWCNWPARA